MKIKDNKNMLDAIKTPQELKKFLLNNTYSDSSKLIYTYTSYESIVSIIKNKSLRLTRIDKLNDKKEKELNSYKYDKTFIMSFTNDNVENIHMWKMYGKSSGIKLKLGIPRNLINSLHKNNQRTKLVKIIKENEYSSKDYSDFVNSYVHEISCVAYIAKRKNGKEVIKYNGKVFNNILVNEDVKRLLNGYLKYDCWQNEKEIRLLVVDETVKKDEYFVYLDIDQDLIDNFEITFNPWINDDLKEEIKKSLNSIANTKLVFKNSKHDHEVDEL